jgi:AAHS family benzoate transporter-like MFS transporter
MIGAVGGWLADRFNIKYVLMGMYALAAVSITLLGFKVPTELLFLLVAWPAPRPSARRSSPMPMRASSIRWRSVRPASAGHRASRSGAILAPIAIGTLVGMALPLEQNFMAIAIPAAIAVIAVSLIRHGRSASVQAAPAMPPRARAVQS